MQMTGRRMRGRFNEPIKRTSRGNRWFPWPVRKANEGWEVERTREEARVRAREGGSEEGDGRERERERQKKREGERD